ncbi:MAG TPA: hypothetical protein VHT24_06660 [Pseudacidobacterium sp.]|jgi:hypothetical protein|nr:hypothetical protein [Pseudacidobacterium sp.]
MMRYIVFALAVFAVCTRAQTTMRDTEQTETGQIQTAQGMRGYKIRLLPVASFPNLPQNIAAQLSLLHCMIPQTFEAHRPENVIHGAFERRGSSDWAALCSHDGSIDLLAFFQSSPEKPFTLVTHRATERMGAETPSSMMGSAWGISTIPLEGLMHTPGIHEHGPFDHDGIEDDYVERSSTVRYYRNGSWLALEGNN